MPLVPSTMDFTSDYQDMPLMALDDDQQDFDYGMFLQQDDADYMAEDSSASASTNRMGITPPQQSPAVAGTSASEVPNGVGFTALVRTTSEAQRQRQRLERRGHTKSRRGCFNCKRRRIKVGFAKSSVYGPHLLGSDTGLMHNRSVKRLDRRAVTVSRRV